MPCTVCMSFIQILTLFVFVQIGYQMFNSNLFCMLLSRTTGEKGIKNKTEPREEKVKIKTHESHTFLYDTTKPAL